MNIFAYLFVIFLENDTEVKERNMDIKNYVLNPIKYNQLIWSRTQNKKRLPKKN